MVRTTGHVELLSGITLVVTSDVEHLRAVQRDVFDCDEAEIEPCDRMARGWSSSTFQRVRLETLR